MLLDLKFAGTRIENLERLRNSNINFYMTLAKKEKWDSVAELARAFKKSIPRTHDLLKKFEENGCVELHYTGNSTEILLTEEFMRYGVIWEKCPKLRGLLKSDLMKLINQYPMHYVAMLLGYTGNNREQNLRKTLMKIGWLEG